MVLNTFLVWQKKIFSGRQTFILLGIIYLFAWLFPELSLAFPGDPSEWPLVFFRANSCCLEEDAFQLSGACHFSSLLYLKTSRMGKSVQCFVFPFFGKLGLTPLHPTLVSERQVQDLELHRGLYKLGLVHSETVEKTKMNKSDGPSKQSSWNMIWKYCDFSWAVVLYVFQATDNSMGPVPPTQTSVTLLNPQESASFYLCSKTFSQ